MTFVVEPGIYVRPQALENLEDTPENRKFKEAVAGAVEKYKGMGVRIEDSFLLTADRPEASLGDGAQDHRRDRTPPEDASSIRRLCRTLNLDWVERIGLWAVESRSGRNLDVRLDARRAVRRPPPGPHADVHAGDVDDAGTGDRRQHRDLQRRQQRPAQAAAVPRAGPARGPLADGARGQHRRPQRRRSPTTSPIAKSRGRWPTSPSGRAPRSRSPARPNRSAWMAIERHLPPAADAGRPADPRPGLHGAGRPGRQPRGRDARPRLLAAAVRRRSGRRRSPRHGRRHARAKIIGVLPKGFWFMDMRHDLVVPIRFDRAKVRLAGYNFQAIGRLRPGVTIAAGERRRRAHDPHRAGQVPAARGHERQDDGGRAARPQRPAAARRSASATSARACGW